MARIALPAGDDSESIKLIGLQPAFGNAMAVLSDAIYNQSSLDLRVREAVRMRIAQLNQCQLCLDFRFPELVEAGIDEAFYAAVADWRSEPSFSAAEKLAIDYAERFANDHLSIDDALMQQLKQHFDAAEMFELTYSIAGLLANGRTLQVLQIDQACQLSKGID
ncbi:MAG: carboxymuconolactone decarboxylase family protein [Pseudomonadales bacterium]|nr:carboxymuconolactone decarboxylase family protein [Pseudomonadales bacterium]